MRTKDAVGIKAVSIEEFTGNGGGNSCKDLLTFYDRQRPAALHVTQVFGQYIQ